MKALPIFLFAAWLVACFDDEESGVTPVPLPECPDHSYATCDVRSADCQSRLLALTACAYGAAEPPTVPIRVVSEARFRQELEAGIAADPDPQDAELVAYFESVLLDLGLVAEGALSAEATVDTIVESYAGVYQDAEAGIVLVDRGMPQNTVDADSLLIHELVHALQDADYDLDSYFEPYRELTDQLLAAKTVSEGEATFLQFRVAGAMLGYGSETLDYERTFQNLRVDLVERARQDPSPYLGSFSTFPYAYGSTLSYRSWLENGAGFEAQQFANPPVSTRDVMRSVSRDARAEPPRTLDPPTDTGDYALVTEDSLGAWLLSLCLFAHHAFEDDAEALALRWAADHIWLYQSADGAQGWLWEIELADAATAQEVARYLDGELPDGLELVQAQRGLFIAGGSAGPPQFLLDAGRAFLAAMVE